MVKLSLVPLKGNAGGRYFPYQGYLGLTPLRVEGVVRTYLEEDGKPIPARSLTVYVRCYEHRQGKTGVLHSRLIVDYPKVLWRKPDSQDFVDFGNSESTFKITLPKRVAGFSTANYQEYRVSWRLEAVLDHVPLVGVGSRIFRCFDLPFVRYDIPPPLPSPSPSPSPSSHHASSTPHTLYHPTFRPQTPVLRYNLSTPVLPIGPSDYVFTSIHLRPLNPAVSIRSATVIIERRIDLHHVTPTSHTFTVHAPDLPPEDPQPPSPIPSRFRSSRSTRPSTTSTLPISVSSSMPESSAVPRRSPYSFTPNHSSSTIDTAPPTPSASTYTITSPLLPPPPPTPHLPSPSTPVDAPSKSLTSIIAYADSGVGGFAVDHASGVWSKTVSIQWPKPRSHHHWAQGETSRSDLANVTFWVRVKIILSSPTSGTESMDLEPQEIIVVSTNDSDRRLALAKFAEQKDLAAQRERSKSKSPGRTRVQGGHTDGEPPAVPSDDDRKSSSSQHSQRHPPPPTRPPPPLPTSPQSPSHPQPSTSKKPSTPKIKTRRPHTSAGPRDKSNLPYNISGKSDPSGHVTRPGTGIANPETRGTMATGFGVTRGVEIGGRNGGNEDLVRAWEEELVRIENVARRSSASIWSFFKFGRNSNRHERTRGRGVTAGAG